MRLNVDAWNSWKFGCNYADSNFNPTKKSISMWCRFIGENYNKVLIQIFMDATQTLHDVDIILYRNDDFIHPHCTFAHSFRDHNWFESTWMQSHVKRRTSPKSNRFTSTLMDIDTFHLRNFGISQSEIRKT